MRWMHFGRSLFQWCFDSRPDIWHRLNRLVQPTPQTRLWIGGLALFGVSVLAGFGLKSFAHRTFTIGHEDYRLIPAERLYALNALREQALGTEASLTPDPVPTYPVCSATSQDLSL